ncbi:xanthine dehydrogenase family protein molybdopterin-binding subunit [Novosphingobium mangrovi (ex Huang et al. 2023)]|uniref:Molybdopterin-dependent oxidoreductase n=1 Tax=Novosphingobium mangrovi (ex Huang et al. 2023) TaxID=2976432 RepID=A0ABT2I8K5_9SPHN|nr:molybdopterin cofactor-binding domain-containing protein [Novosphingobium mangrovi (ex Huang et al. 2023)]MCT2401104.1 molybdopterin-dependent oxidoreductase [Novosphingobium mangrovi (ex Huang et al. 2023)]
MAVTRRGILIGALAGGGLVLGYFLRPRHFPLPLAPGPGEFAFDAWIKIGKDGVISVAVPQVEMGQGVTTLIPQVVAHELGADWRQVGVEPVPLSALYANLALAARWAPLWLPLAPSLGDEPDDMLTRRWAQDHRFNATADGTSLAAYEGPARAAAASARAMLMQAAAARWNVAWEECEAKAGFVVHADKRLPFGALVEEAAAYAPPSTPPLRVDAMAESPGEFPPGASLRYPRLDLPSKVDGSWTFAGDVRLPDMVHAAIRHAPLGASASLSSIKEDAAKNMKGFLRVVKGEGWVAAVARDWWTADTALARMVPRFRVATALESTDVDNALDAAMRAGQPHRIHASGDMAVVEGGLPLQLRYEVVPAIHATIETASVTARLADGRLELWVGTQAPTATCEAAARVIGIDPADVVLYPMPLGGSFDRRLEFGHAVEAAILTKETGRPVQLTWSRREEMRASLPRTPVVAVMAARSDTEGGIAGWRARVAMPATVREFGRRLFDGDTPVEAIEAVAGKQDPLALEGAVPPYEIPSVAVDHVPARIALPTARLRGNAHGYTAFFNECFVDELAHKAGREPLSYRMAMLGKNPRLAECLQRVAALAQWDGGGDNSGQGIACHVIGEGRIAVVASARRDENGVRVDRLSAVADIGRIVNFDIARQQVEGGLVFGLGLALGCSVRYEHGRPDSDRLLGLGLPVLADCPTIEVEFIESTEEPADPGELGVAAVAPAVANALFSATGLRSRHLPLFGEEL